MKKLCLLVSVIVLGVLCTPNDAWSTTEQLNIYQAPGGITQRVYFQSFSQDEAPLLAFREKLLRLGAQRINCFLPSVIVCELPVNVSPAELIDDPNIVMRAEATIGARGVNDPIFGIRWVKRLYDDADAHEFETRAANAAPAYYGEEHTISHKPVPTRREGPAASAGRAERTLQQNSEILFGNILAQYVFPESEQVPGNFENWTDERLNIAANRATLGMLYYQQHYPSVPINFILRRFERIPTAVEPINQTKVDEAVWITPVMNSLGYSGDPAKPEEAVHAFNEEKRKQIGADWAYTAFIVSSESVVNHRFKDTQINAWAWIGGPYLVMPFPVGAPNRAVGVGDFTANFRHYFGHIFWGLDEALAGHACDKRSGYLAVQNQNKLTDIGPMGAEQGCPGRVQPVSCIMDLDDATGPFRYSGPPCGYSRGMFGLADDNSNGVPDALDAAPTVEWESADAETVTSDDLTLNFQVVSYGVDNLNPAQPESERTNYALPIKIVGRSHAGILIQKINPVDGVYDEIVEEFVMNISPVPSGLSAITVLAKNSMNASAEYVKPIVFLGLTYGVFRFVFDNDGIGINWNLVGETFNATMDLHRVDENGNDKIIETKTAGPPEGAFTPFSAFDPNVVPGADYSYYVAGSFIVPFQGQMTTFTTDSGEFETTAMLPIDADATISTIAPNPFRDRALVSITVPPTFQRINDTTTFGDLVQTEVTVTVFDVMGRQVKLLHNAAVFTQILTLEWDGTNDRNAPSPSGIYFIKVAAGSTQGVQKVVLVR